MNRIKFKDLLALIERTAFEKATAKIQDWKRYDVIIDAAMDELVDWYDEHTFCGMPVKITDSAPKGKITLGDFSMYMQEEEGGFIFIDSDFPQVSQLPTELQDSLDKALKHRIDALNARWIEQETKRIMEDDVFETDDDPIGEMMRIESMIEGARLGREVDAEIMNECPMIEPEDIVEFCGSCQKPMQLVRPGKYQCVNPDCEYCR
jgi:hypothetical protein